jgi:hypothetical protein
MDWKNNKWVWIIVGVTIFNVVLFGMSELIVRRTTNKVIERLQKEYSPSPYGPGIDPDKVNPDAFRRKVEFRFDEQPTQTEEKTPPTCGRHQVTPVEEKPKKKVEEVAPKKTDWLDDWEKQRREE